MAKSATASPVVALWERIEAWLQANEPVLRKELLKGATEAEIAKFEKQIGVALPPEYRDSLRRHNGSKDSDLIPDESGPFYFLPCRDAASEWSTWNLVRNSGDFDDRVAEPSRGVCKEWWHPGWIPFATNGGGDNLCLDLSPAKGGVAGQVIRVMHDRPERTRIAPSFTAWLKWLAKALESGARDEM